MLALSTTFIIFSGSGIATQAGGILQQMKSFFGSDITISSLFNKKLVLDEYHISKYLTEFNATNPNVIKAWSYATYPLGEFNGVNHIDIMPLSMFPKIKANIIGVDSNIMDSVYNDYYLPGDYQKGIDYKAFKENPWKNDGVSPIFESAPLETFDFDPYEILANSKFYPKEHIQFKTRRVVLPVG